MRPRSIGTSANFACGACALHEGVEAGAVRGGNVEEIERRRLFRQRLGELLAQIAVDLDDGHQQGDAQPEREHDRRRQRAGAVDIGERHAQGGRARVRQARGDKHQQAGDQPQHDKDRGGGADEDHGDAPVIGEQHGEGGEQSDGRHR